MTSTIITIVVIILLLIIAAIGYVIKQFEKKERDTLLAAVQAEFDKSHKEQEFADKVDGIIAVTAKKLSSPDNAISQKYAMARDSDARHALINDVFENLAKNEFATQTARQMSDRCAQKTWKITCEHIYSYSALKNIEQKAFDLPDVISIREMSDVVRAYVKEAQYLNTKKLEEEHKEAKRQLRELQRIRIEHDERAQKQLEEKRKEQERRAAAKTVYKSMSASERKELSSRKTPTSRKQQIAASYYTDTNDFLTYFPLLIAVASTFESESSTSSSSSYASSSTHDSGSSYGYGSSYSHDHSSSWSSSHDSSSSSYDSGSSFDSGSY